MTQPEIAEIVRKNFPFLEDDELINEIARVGQYMTIPQGEIMIDIGQNLTHMPLFVEGLVKVHREDSEGQELFLYFLEAGSTCAASLTCCMNERKSEIRAETEEDTSCVSVPIEYIDAWLVKYPSWKRFIFSAYSSRFEELLNTVDELAFKHLDERLMGYLEERSDRVKNSVLEISHRQIAHDLNSSREVISRLLKQLENHGKIKLGRSKIEVLQG